MRSVLVAVVVLGLVSSAMSVTTGGWKKSPGNLNELHRLITSVKGWDNKYDGEEADALLNPKVCKIRLHESQVVAGSKQLYIINSLRGTECFIFYKDLKGKISLNGWVGSHTKVSDADLTHFRSGCLASIGTPNLMNIVDYFWPTATGRFVTKKYDQAKKDAYKEAHHYSSGAVLGAEAVGFFDFARAN